MITFQVVLRGAEAFGQAITAVTGVIELCALYFVVSLARSHSLSFRCRKRGADQACSSFFHVSPRIERNVKSLDICKTAKKKKKIPK